MNIILLSGGSGKRLWPLSNDIRSKQFIKMFKNEKGKYESMVQRVYRQIKEVDPNANITIATSKKQVSAIHNQLGNNVSVCVEPARRDTFPAIALAAAYLKSEQKLQEDEAVLVCPVDPYVDRNYFESLMRLHKLVEHGDYRLNLMGIEPTYPSEKYGYIIPKNSNPVAQVEEFKEKPTANVAEKYIAQGALWNAGVFGFKLGYLLDIAHKYIDFYSYWDIYHQYDNLEKISFDYAVVEKETSIGTIRFAGQWKDIGSWNTFAEEMSEVAIGKVTLDTTCDNTHVVNELNIPILCMGCKDLLIAASGDGILITDKVQSSYIKPYVDKMDQQAMYAEKSWGSFTVLDVQPESMTIRIVLQPGHQLHYHSHEHREELWNIVSGSGRVIIDGDEQQVRAGDVIGINIGCKHTLIADSELKVIEVQIGSEITVEDKVKHELMFSSKRIFVDNALNVMLNK